MFLFYLENFIYLFFNVSILYRLDSDRLAVGLSDLKVLFQPNGFMIPFKQVYVTCIT